jgi:K+-sensing histidine kinase KdpD
MKEDGTESIVLLGAGPLAAILLGLFLVPFRDFTSASNFGFLFMALTILVAEYGGRRPAVATALCSALSLDFFLTKPYLQLTIVDKHDIIAFFGLGACGLIAAALGSQRGERNAALSASRRELLLLHAAISGLESSAPFASRLGAVLDAAAEACPIAAAVVRDEQNQVLTVIGEERVASGIPAEILAANTLLPRGILEDDRPHEIPISGARLPLTVGSRQLGWLDLWGNGVAASPQSRRSLGDAARVLAYLLTAPVRANL